MKRPFFRAQFWKSNTTRRHHQVLSRAFAPECLQCAPCPARRWVASAVVKAAGAFRFPFVGTYARSSVVVAAGVSPAQAWEDFHSHEVPRLAAVDVLNLASGLWPTDLLPDHCISTSCCAMWSPRVIRGERPRPNSGWYGAIGNRYGVNRPTKLFLHASSGPSCPLAPAGRPGLRLPVSFAV